MTTQSKTTHTPGPWHVNGQTIFSPARLKAAKVIASIGDGDRGEATNEANARLIAAAPDGLALAQWILDRDEKGELRGAIRSGLLKRCNALIAKATGLERETP